MGKQGDLENSELHSKSKGFKSLPWYIKQTSWENKLHDGLKHRNLYQDRESPFRFERDVMYRDFFYIVHVTHPEQPNYSGHSRGRTSHLALNKKRGSKSLCNMLVDYVHREQIDVRTDGEYSSNRAVAGCKVCMDKAPKIERQYSNGEIDKWGLSQRLNQAVSDNGHARTLQDHPSKTNDGGRDGASE